MGGAYRFEEDEVAEQMAALAADDQVGSEEAVVLYLIGHCGQWSAKAMHYDHDQVDKDKARQTIQDQHKADHPGCQLGLSFGYI